MQHRKMVAYTFVNVVSFRVFIIVVLRFAVFVFPAKEVGAHEPSRYFALPSKYPASQKGRSHHRADKIDNSTHVVFMRVIVFTKPAAIYRIGFI